MSARRILIADDSAMVVALLSRVLREGGYTVSHAVNGIEAVQRAYNDPPDLLILDIFMPRMNGYQVCRMLKGDPVMAALPIIILSGSEDRSDEFWSLQTGADAFMSKPFERAALLETVARLLPEQPAAIAPPPGELGPEDILSKVGALLDRQLYTATVQRLEIEALSKAKDDLTHMIVHDLRTPLTALIGGLQTMETLGELNPDQREFLRMSLDGGETLLGMINELLDISKLEDGSLRLEYRELSAETLARSAAQQVAHLAENKGLRLATVVEPELPPLRADEDKVRRTLVNLLGNAIKFTPRGGSITLGARRAGDDMVFSVNDTGEGIPREAFERIFEKFGQVESRKAGRKMSTGLGLTFCKMAVEAHGGRIWVESEPEVGSTFSFTLPLVARSG